MNSMDTSASTHAFIDDIGCFIVLCMHVSFVSVVALYECTVKKKQKCFLHVRLMRSIHISIQIAMNVHSGKVD